jgi:hypothetical protein
MLTGTRATLRGRLRSEHGVTLVELLVAMAAGIVVLFGLLSIMIVTLHQTQRTFTTVDATRRARTAFANIENDLHSACVAGKPPIEGVTGGVTESDANHLVFLSFFGTAANPTPIWHQLSFNSAAGTLIDSTYNVTGTSPDWIQGSLIANTTLLTNVARLSTTTPVFQYYAYAPEYTDSSGNVYWIIPDGTNAVPITGTVPASAPLSTSSPGLSASDAGITAEVVINLSVGASSGGLNNASLTAVNDPVTDSISLRLTTPPDYVPSGATAAGYLPCS